MNDSVDDTLGADHEHLDELFQALREEIAGGSRSASDALGRFEAPLRLHMQWEEKHLFPAVRDHCTEKEKRSIESLEIDHERILDTLGEIGSALSEGQFGEASKQCDWLESLLKGHNYDEEHGVYVEADRYLDPKARQELLSRFATIKDGKGDS